MRLRRVAALSAGILLVLAVDRALSAPVKQLPPGRVIVARVATDQGPVVIALHRIRYLGKVALCMSESNEGGTGQSCAHYPLGPRSNQPIGKAPVWWTTYIGACAPRHFQVISGALLRTGLTAWLRSPSGLRRMPIAPVPRAFGVTGVTYALITGSPAAVTLRDAAGHAVYEAPVEPLPKLPTAGCKHGTSTMIAIGAPGHVIP